MSMSDSSLNISIPGASAVAAFHLYTGLYTDSLAFILPHFSIASYGSPLSWFPCPRPVIFAIFCQNIVIDSHVNEKKNKPAKNASTRRNNAHKQPPQYQPEILYTNGNNGASGRADAAVFLEP